jgi:hypothetical protein
MRRVARAALIGSLLLGTAAARAEGELPTEYDRRSELLVASDPLDRARLVAAIGDAAVLAWLTGQGGASVAEQLAAVRASAWLADPSAALGPLVALLGGRDPDLAPSAALALERIGQRLALEEPACEACAPEAIASASDALSKLADNPRLRPDLRLRALTASAQLASARARFEP